MTELQLLEAGHLEALREFELANRAYFAASITDRGDEFFAQFEERLEARLEEQRAGEAAFHVLVDDDDSVLGRFNLIFVRKHVAELGFRVAERATGRGVATAAVRELCDVAAGRYGVRLLRASASLANHGSRAVLTKAGFVEVGPADPSEVGGKEGTWFERVLVEG
jgi:ribosomal-protein-alanine N-acetyltransferase